MGAANPMRSFDAERLGRAERDAWAAYYLRQWRRFLSAALLMVREGFGMGRARTLLAAWWVLRANQQWAPFPDNDPDAARASMTRFYALVRRAHGLDLDPPRAAELEVEWWRAHRAAQHDPSLGSSELVDALTALYAYVYRAPAEAVREAARLRAEAMVVSDGWVAAGCDPTSPDLREEGDLLVRSYRSLLAAVR